jgi:hypothetical protein
MLQTWIFLMLPKRLCFFLAKFVRNSTIFRLLQPNHIDQIRCGTGVQDRLLVDVFLIGGLRKLIEYAEETQTKMRSLHIHFTPSEKVTG